MTRKTDQWLSELATPTGLPGSGRLRYGAAMALHRAGLLGDAELEVYRICAPLDRQDPIALLRAGGLVLPPLPPATGQDAIRCLVAEVDRYLAGLSGPGVAEVRAGLNAAGHGPVVPTGTDRPNPTVAAHLPDALVALHGTHPALAQAIVAAVPHLKWITYDGYPVDQIGTAFAEGHAYAMLIGAQAPIAASGFDLGLFLIGPHVLYRDHHHAAPELYAPLTGPHGWRFGTGRPLVIKPAHQPVWNPPFAPHLTKVGPVPFLCIFGWTRDVEALASVIPADDWPALEALRLPGAPPVEA